MNSQEIRHKFLNFFEAKGHKIVPSSSLVSADPSVLLTTAGMQQFKPYFVGEKDPIRDFGSKNTVSIQKSFRTSDIDEVGDESHLTFFEMLGSFSFGGYFKREAIRMAWEFLLDLFGEKIRYPHYANASRGRQISNIKNTNQISKIGITVFGGDDEVPVDEESYGVWRDEIGVPEESIGRRGREDNFWGPTGREGPCGPTTEIYINGVEIWNIVFNEFYCRPDGSLKPLMVKGVDTGMGLERLAAAAQGKNIFETDLFRHINLIPESVPEQQKRIIADHLRGSVFLLADGVRPSNKDRGYILRRLLRRALVYEHIYKVHSAVFRAIVEEIIGTYGQFYTELSGNHEVISREIGLEQDLFGKTLERGLKELGRLDRVDAKMSFDLYQSFGLPFEVIKELGGPKTSALTLESFNSELQKHQEISRAGAEKKFGGHGITSGDLTASDEKELKIKTRLHTATHLLNAALHRVLDDRVSQRGSDITSERTRFDFIFDRKLTPEEIEQVENLVNQVISRDCPVKMEEMPFEEARKTGALFFDQGKYPDVVRVYTIGGNGEVFSKEVCGGPHVSRAGEIGRFRIIKEESSSAGVRRIRAVVE